MSATKILHIPCEPYETESFDIELCIKRTVRVTGHDVFLRDCLEPEIKGCVGFIPLPPKQSLVVVLATEVIS